MMATYEEKRAELRRQALEYHEFPTPGKVAIMATKQLTNQRDLALAYSPGVAAACDAIVADPGEARTLTSRGNLVAVVGQTQLLQPFLTLFASALLLGEALDPATFVAAGLVILSIAIGRRFGTR